MQICKELLQCSERKNSSSIVAQAVRAVAVVFVVIEEVSSATVGGAAGTGATAAAREGYDLSLIHI